MRNILSLFTLLFLTVAGWSQQIQIIPQPVSIQVGKGSFRISKKTVIAAKDEADRKTAQLFNAYLKQVYGLELDIDHQEGKNYIRLSTKKFIKAPDKDAYSLTVTADGISIDGDTYAGTFYGIQTLIQLLPVHAGVPLTIPFVTIEDYPQFSYRGMHLDVSRHFFPVPFIKKYIDYLVLHKLNFFHWHLTDDQGWRIEIKKYPRLTEAGGVRNGTIIGRYPGTGNDNLRYGGFYTQEEIKEIVQYATDRHITVVPEIEMPGHASAAIAAYPRLSCFPDEETIIPSHPSEASKNSTGKKVQETWGVFEDVFCAGKDSTFFFLQDVLDEVIALFPSSYVHIGGDESPKANWKRCPNCQARIKQEGLKDEHELQSYFIQRIEKHLNAKGKIAIGWDEILEGGLAPNAWVMSWRGEAGGIEAAKQKHNVIMTPGSHVYFDHSQTRNEDSVVIGGYTPIEKVYSYQPIPKELDSVHSKYIMGAQANLWTEYIKNWSKVEYMIFPRMSALSEVLWSPGSKKNWNDFERRLTQQFKRYDLWKVNYSKAYYDVDISLLPTHNNHGIQLKAASKRKDGSIRIQGKNLKPTRYNKPITLTKSETISVSYNKGSQAITKSTFTLNFNKATGKKASISTPPNERYPGQPGAFSLVNGIYSNKGLSSPDWLGWIGDDLEATIDLGRLTSFSSVRMHTLDQNGSWIYLPEYVEVFTSKDGKNFRQAGRSTQFIKDTLTMGWITVSFPKTTSRYIKLVAKNKGMIGEGLPGAGNKAWLFADEIQAY